MRKLIHSLFFGAAWLATPLLAQTVSNSPAFTVEESHRAIMDAQRQLALSIVSEQQRQGLRQARTVGLTATQTQVASATSVLQAALAAQEAMPSKLSPTLRDFLATRKRLMQAEVVSENQVLQSLPSSATQEQIQQAKSQTRQLYGQQHAIQSNLQVGQVWSLSQESAQMQWATPPQGEVQSNGSPQLATFLTTSNQLLLRQIQFHNQYATADPATRLAAQQQWLQQNAGLIKQMRQQAMSMSKPVKHQKMKN